MQEATKQVSAAIKAMAAIADAIRDLKEVPSGTFYANVMSILTLEQYNRVIELLKGTGLVTEQNHLLRWIGDSDL